MCTSYISKLSLQLHYLFMATKHDIKLWRKIFVHTLIFSDLLSINLLLSDLLVWVAFNNLCALGHTLSCSVCKLFIVLTNE